LKQSVNVSTTLQAKLLVVAGGGGGGTDVGGTPGGGGAGGFIYRENYEISRKPTNYSVIVGVGGIGSGFDSSFGVFGDETVKIVASGGGGGGNGGVAHYCYEGGNGGSGGGGSKNDYNPCAPGKGILGQGHDGAGGGGGGGGAGGAAIYGLPDGGDGLPCNITGRQLYYAGGGAAGISIAKGGKGGGGDYSQPGVDYTGGGGGANARGGNGIVIISLSTENNPAGEQLSTFISSPLSLFSH
jgi:fibronectin-binding autotransporter adhesin